MKRIIFIITVILILSSTGQALSSSNQYAIPVETIITEPVYTGLQVDIWRTLAESSTLSMFRGQPLRVRIKITITRQDADTFLFSADWFIRNDKVSLKFIPIPGGFLTGYFGSRETSDAAARIIEYTEELLFPETDLAEDEYIDETELDGDAVTY